MQIDKMAGTDNVGLVYCAMVQFDAKGRLLSLIPEKNCQKNTLPVRFLILC